MSKLQDMSRSVDSVPIPQISVKKPMTAASPYNRTTAATTIMPNIYSSEFLEKDGRHTQSRVLSEEKKSMTSLNRLEDNFVNCED